VEVKKLGKWNPAYHMPTIQFGDDQTKAMRQMKTQPFVVVFGEEPERYYLLTPEVVAKKVESRKKPASNLDNRKQAQNSRNPLLQFLRSSA